MRRKKTEFLGELASRASWFMKDPGSVRLLGEATRSLGGGWVATVAGGMRRELGHKGTSSSALCGNWGAILGPTCSDIVRAQDMRVAGNRDLQWSPSVAFME